MKSLTSAALLASAATFLCLSPASAADPHAKAQPLPPSVSSGTCAENTAAYSVSTDLQKSSSRNYRDVTGTSVTFTQGAPGCVEVSFTAEGAATPHELLITRALLDGRECLPTDNIFASDSPSSDLADHAMNYICPSVSAGAHTAKIQFRSRFGGKVALDYRTTIVRYTP